MYTIIITQHGTTYVSVHYMSPYTTYLPNTHRSAAVETVEAFCSFHQNFVKYIVVIKYIYRISSNNSRDD